MGWVSDAVRHPRRLRLRRVMFQVHLWAGLLLSLYLVVVAVSGSVLVFRDELTRWALPAGLHPFQEGAAASPEAVVASFETAVPGGRLENLQAPSVVLPAYLLTGSDAAGRPGRWIADPATAAVQPSPRTWLDWTLALHEDLLLPPTVGLQLNAAGGAGLLLLVVSGMVLWWPGLRAWTRGLRVNVRANWRRINYDLHSAIGFWTLLLVFWWALSGMYFGWYRQVAAVVGAVSPLRGMVSPAPAALAPPAAGVRASLAQVLDAAKAASPQGRLWSVSDPLLRGKESYVLMDLRAPGDFSHRDIVRVRTADARVLSVWHYGVRHSAGDWVLWLMHPLHFGTLWGEGVKVLWAVLGLTLAGLTITGVLMYWNRFLSHRWRERA